MTDHQAVADFVLSTRETGCKEWWRRDSSNRRSVGIDRRRCIASVGRVGCWIGCLIAGVLVWRIGPVRIRTTGTIVTHS